MIPESRLSAIEALVCALGMSVDEQRELCRGYREAQRLREGTSQPAYAPRYDEAAMDAFVAEGTKAWADEPLSCERIEREARR